MSNDFPEGEFIPPHKQRKKPDCDREPIIPDPCTLRNPKNQNFFSTNPPCLNDEIEVVCPADLIITQQHDKIVTFEVDPVEPSEPLPPVPPPGPAISFPNERIVVSCPSNQQEADDLAEYLTPCGIAYPDPEGHFPNIGNTITVQEGTYFADTQEKANELAKEEIRKIICDSLNCLWGNDPMEFVCEDYLTADDLNFLAELGLGRSDLIRGESIQVPENLFTSEFSKADANRLASEYAQTVIQDLCFYCNPEKVKECPPQFQPTEGFTVEECSMQNTFALASLRELDAKAAEYLDSLVCVSTPFFNDEFCEDFFASIIIDNPNEQNDCGTGDAAYKRGSNDGEVANDGMVCGFTAKINLPQIPCPCGYDFKVNLRNPNSEEACGTGDAAYSPGTGTNDITSEPNDEKPCVQELTIELPKIPCPCGYDFQIQFTNPNTTEACGTKNATYSPGTASNDITSQSDNDNPCLQKLAIELPQIPCPCGYDFQIKLINPNTEGACGSNDSSYAPGTGTNDITSRSDENNPCLQKLDIELPLIPCPCGYKFDVSLTNPNVEPECGSGETKYSPGTATDALLNKPDPDGSECRQVIDIELPQIPCPCGYKVEVQLENPNTAASCGVGAAAYSPGTATQVLKDEEDSCTTVIPLELPKIPCPCGYKVLLYVRSCMEQSDGSFRYTVTRYGDGTNGDPCTLNLGLVTIPCIPFADIDIPSIIADTLDIECVLDTIIMCISNSNATGSSGRKIISPHTDENGKCKDDVETYNFNRSQELAGNNTDLFDSSCWKEYTISATHGDLVKMGILIMPKVLIMIGQRAVEVEVDGPPATLNLQDDCGGSNITRQVGTWAPSDIDKDIEISVTKSNGCPKPEGDLCSITIPIEMPNICGEIKFSDEEADQLTVEQKNEHQVAKKKLAVKLKPDPGNKGDLPENPGECVEWDPATLDPLTGEPDENSVCISHECQPSEDPGGCMFAFEGEIDLPCVPIPKVGAAGIDVTYKNKGGGNPDGTLNVEKTQDCIDGIAKFELTGVDIVIPCIPVTTAAQGAVIIEKGGDPANPLGKVTLDSKPFDAADPEGCGEFFVADTVIELPCIPEIDVSPVVQIMSHPGDGGDVLGEVKLEEEPNAANQDCPKIQIADVDIVLPCLPKFDQDSDFQVVFKTDKGNDLGDVSMVESADADGCPILSLVNSLGGDIIIPTSCPTVVSNIAIVTDHTNNPVDELSIETREENGECKIEFLGDGFQLPCPGGFVGSGNDNNVTFKDSTGAELGSIQITTTTNSDNCEAVGITGGPITIPTGCPEMGSNNVQITDYQNNSVSDIYVSVNSSGNDCIVDIEGDGFQLPCPGGMIKSGNDNLVKLVDDNQNTLGQISLTTNNDCEMGLSGGTITISTGCPGERGDKVIINDHTNNPVSELEVKVDTSNNDCNVYLDGSGFNLPCPLVIDGTDNNIDIVEPDGTVKGSITLAEGTDSDSCGTVKFSSTTDIEIPCPLKIDPTNNSINFIDQNGNNVGNITLAEGTDTSSCPTVKFSSTNDIEVGGGCVVSQQTAATGLNIKDADDNILGTWFVGDRAPTNGQSNDCTEFYLGGSDIILPASGDCPGVDTSTTVDIKVGSDVLGSIYVDKDTSNNDCKVIIGGNDIDIKDKACEIVSAAFVASGSVQFDDPTGTIGTIQPSFNDGTCTYQFDANNSGTPISILPGYSEQTITVCNSSGGTDTWTILAK